jgi:hypothetical protein
VGTYYDTVTATGCAVKQYEGQLLWGTNVLGTPFSVFMDYFKSTPGSGATSPADYFRVYLPPGTFPCLLGELEALTGQYIIFTRDAASNNVTATSLPGWIPGVSWPKISAAPVPLTEAAAAAATP